MPLSRELFKDELNKGIPVFMGDRESVVYSELESDEKAAVEKVFKYGLNQIRRISPKIASDIEPQLSIALKVAGIFKEMLPEKKSYTFPSQTGTLGVAWLFPQAIKYATTVPTGYTTNSWDIPLTAGSRAYLFGSEAGGVVTYYRTSDTAKAHSAILVFNNGIIEIGSTPKIEQFRLVSEGFTKYGIYTVAPIVEERIEENRLIYQYPTPLGAVPIFYDKGVAWSVMPKVTGTSTIKLLGLVFYEHDFAADLKWVS
jgi:hypothetical protein